MNHFSRKAALRRLGLVGKLLSQVLGEAQKEGRALPTGAIVSDSHGYSPCFAVGKRGDIGLNRTRN
jgi:hypothetical protein